MNSTQLHKTRERRELSKVEVRI